MISAKGNRLYHSNLRMVKLFRSFVVAEGLVVGILHQVDSTFTRVSLRTK